MFYTFIWTFCPQLIIDGYVYAGVPPLYKIIKGKDEYIYLKDEAALEEFKAQNVGKKYIVNRLKGLGEMDADETSILVDPDKRIDRKDYGDNVKVVNDNIYGGAPEVNEEDLNGLDINELANVFEDKDF